MRKINFALAPTLALTLVSCGSNAKLYPVYGTVTYKGEAASGAAIFFYRQGADSINEHTIMGIVQDNGTFEVVCGSLGSGAPPGEYDVLIEWRATSSQNKGHAQRGPDKLKGRYSGRTHPLLHAIVEAKSDNHFNFDLQDAEPPTKQ
jgi:hypothetical protein